MTSTVHAQLANLRTIPPKIEDIAFLEFGYKQYFWYVSHLAEENYAENGAMVVTNRGNFIKVFA